MRSACPAHLILLDFISLIISVKRTSYEVSNYALLFNLPPFPPSQFQTFSSAPCSQIPSMYARFEVFTAVRIQVETFWGVMPCIVSLGYQRFGGPCCLHLQGLRYPTAIPHGIRTRLEVQVLRLGRIPHVKSLLNFFVNAISICYYRSQIFELSHILND